MAPGTNCERSDFLEHVERCKLFAVAESSPTGTRPIISIRALRSYLTTDRLRKLLLYVTSTSNYERIVRDRYLAVFSVLLSIDRGPYITNFVQHDQLADERLPFLTRDEWPEVCKVIFAEFYEAQWKFCAKRLVHDRLNDTRLHEDMVVPFKRKERLKDGPDSTIFRVELFEEYNHLFPGQLKHPPTNVFILKSCRSDYTKLHNNEVEAYRTLLSHPSGQDAMQYMARFYGSWIQGETCNILREYVGGGTLTNFFERTEPPTTADDILEFWRNFVQLVKPIACIHHLPNPHNHRSYKVGLHNDIKPDNILVSEQHGSNPYNLSYKLADLGLAGFVVADDFDETQLRDVHGTKMYSAPEYFRGENDRSRQQSIKQAHPPKDIWALACVISEAAVWSVFGHTELIDYRNRRAEAVATIPSLANTGYSGCFHDTTKVLAVVEAMHKEVSHRRRANIDNVVSQVLLIVGGMVIQDPTKRPDAWRVYDELTRAVELATPPGHNAITQTLATIIHPRHSVSGDSPPEIPNALHLDLGAPSLQSANDSQGHQTNHSLDRHRTIGASPRARPFSGAPSIGQEETPRRSPHEVALNTAHGLQHIPTSGINSPVLQSSTSVGRTVLPAASIADVLSYIHRKKLYSGTTPLQGEKWLERLHGRDQIFLIDDSESMLQHWKEVKSVFEALAYLVKTMDTDGIELRFTNSCKHDGQERDRKGLIRNFEKVKPDGQCQMGIALSRILPKYYQGQTNKRLSWSSRVEDKPAVNIYILTDGVWSEGQNCLFTVQEHITRLANHLYNTGKLQHVGIEFIRFGDDEVGRQRLEYLDNDGLQRYDVPIDIVDTEPSTGNVFKMLLASTDSTWDRQGSG